MKARRRAALRMAMASIVTATVISMRETGAMTSSKDTEFIDSPMASATKENFTVGHSKAKGHSSPNKLQRRIQIT